MKYDTMQMQQNKLKYWIKIIKVISLLNLLFFKLYYYITSLQLLSSNFYKQNLSYLKNLIFFATWIYIENFTNYYTCR